MSLERSHLAEQTRADGETGGDCEAEGSEPLAVGQLVHHELGGERSERVAGACTEDEREAVRTPEEVGPDRDRRETTERRHQRRRAGVMRGALRRRCSDPCDSADDQYHGEDLTPSDALAENPDAEC